MKTIALLLLALTASFDCPAQVSRATKAKPKIKTVFNPELLGQMTSGLTVQHIKAVYGKVLTVKKVTRNTYYPDDRDTVLTVNTGADKLEVFTNRYNSFPLKANVTSKRLNFGHGIRVGVSKAIFCKMFGLPTAFDAYQVIDECGTNLYFIFRQSVLTEVDFQEGDCE